MRKSCCRMLSTPVKSVLRKTISGGWNGGIMVKRSLTIQNYGKQQKSYCRSRYRRDQNRGNFLARGDKCAQQIYQDSARFPPEVFGSSAGFDPAGFGWRKIRLAGIGNTWLG